MAFHQVLNLIFLAGILAAFSSSAFSQSNGGVPPQWKEWVDGAVASHPAVKAAAHTARAEALKIGPAGAPPDPMVMAEFMKLPLGSAATMRETEYSVTENIPFPVRLGWAAARQRQTAEAARFALEQKRRAVHRDGVRALLGLATATRMVAVANERLSQARLLESVIIARYGANKATQSEWGRVKIMVAMAKAESLMAEGDRSEALVVVGRLGPTNHLAIDRALLWSPTATAVVPGPETVEQGSLASFPEIGMQKAMESRMKAEKAMMGWDWAPDLTVKGTLTQSESGEANGSVGVGISVPIWFALRQAPNAQAAGAMALAEAEKSKDTRAMVAELARMAATRFMAVNGALRVLLESAAPQADQVVEVALKEYQVDRISFTELIEALKAVTDTSLEIAKTRRLWGELAEEIRYLTGSPAAPGMP